MSQPEEIKIQQGEESYSFYVIAKGECECFVKDENRKERFVRTLYPGDHFGEIAIITGNPRTATIQTKNYSTIGQMSKEHMIELFQEFPEVKNKMTHALAGYQDRFKIWQKKQLSNVIYLADLSFDSLEKLTYKLGHQFFEEGQYLFMNGDVLDKVFILADGQIEVFCSLADEDIVLDILQ